MKMREAAVLAGALTSVAGIPAAQAYELGSPGFVQKPGVVLGAAAAAPPPGLYSFEQLFTYQSHLVGPGAPIDVNGNATGVKASVVAQGLLYVPGWTLFGGTYDFAAAVPFVSASAGSPINNNPSGTHNAFFANELSWRLGESGFFLKAALGVYAPTGTLEGPAGLGSIGNPWWTIQPNLVFSYLKDGWNLTVNVFDEINTANTRADYRTGDIFHAEFTATKTIGKWTLGPVAYYVGQITNDRSSSFYGGAINVNRYDIWAAGGMIGYDFGPVSLSVWGTQEFSATASGGTGGLPGVDSASITKGFSVFAQLNYRIWAPDSPSSPSISQFHK